MTIKLIVTDLDQTLLRSDKTISEYTVSILQKCRLRGIKIVYASARSVQAAKVFMERFCPDGYIGYGGALVKWQSKTILEQGIPADICDKLIERLKTEPDIYCIFAINESIALCSNSKLIEENSNEHYSYYNFAEPLKQSFLKISLTSHSPAMVERIARDFPMLDLLRYTGEDLYRFAHKTAVKETALAKLTDFLSIDKNDVAVFGDDSNDLGMISMCQNSVAVSNAIDTVKRAATYMCLSNDEDGMAHWLQQEVLND